MMDLILEHRGIVKRIFDANMPGSDVRGFGSRVKGNASEFSDLDLSGEFREVIQKHNEPR